MEHDIDHLMAALSSPDMRVRSRAGQLLLRMFGREAVPYLISALATSAGYVQADIASLLGQAGDERAVMPLIGLFEHAMQAPSANTWNYEARAAATALGQLGDRRAVDVLLQALRYPGISYWAAQALGSLHDPMAVEPLIDALRANKDPSIATLLGNWGDPRAVEPLIAELELLRQPMTTREIDRLWGGPRWRGIYFYYVAHGLGKLGDPRALPILEWVRDHEQEPALKGKSIGYKAARAIERIHARMRASTERDQGIQ